MAALPASRSRTLPAPAEPRFERVTSLVAFGLGLAVALAWIATRFA